LLLQKNENYIKGELGVLQIPLHQQKFLVVSVLSNSPWLPRYLKKCPKWNYEVLFSWQDKS